MQLQNSTINFDTLWQKASLFSLFIVIVSCMKLKRKCRIPDRWSPPATKVPCKSDTRPLPFRLSTRRRDVKLFLNSTVCKQTISTIQKKTQDLRLRFTCGCGQSKMSEMPTVLHPWRMLVQGVVFHVSVEHCVVNLLPFLRLTLSISLQINWGYRTSPSFPGAGLQALKVLVAFGGKKTHESTKISNISSGTKSPCFTRRVACFPMSFVLVPAQKDARPSEGGRRHLDKTEQKDLTFTSFSWRTPWPSRRPTAPLLNEAASSQHSAQRRSSWYCASPKTNLHCVVSL